MLLHVLGITGLHDLLHHQLRRLVALALGIEDRGLEQGFVGFLTGQDGRHILIANDRQRRLLLSWLREWNISREKAAPEKHDSDYSTRGRTESKGTIVRHRHLP